MGDRGLAAAHMACNVFLLLSNSMKRDNETFITSFKSGLDQVQEQLTQYLLQDSYKRDIEESTGNCGGHL